MFDIGFSEVLLIFGLALVVLGPDKLPGVARTVGRWAGRARAMARQFRDQLEAESDGLKVDLNTPPQPATPKSAAPQSTTPPPSDAPTPAPSPESSPAPPWVPPPDSPHGETPPAPPPESLSSIDPSNDRRE